MASNGAARVRSCRVVLAINGAARAQSCRGVLASIGAARARFWSHCRASYQAVETRVSAAGAIAQSLIGYWPKHRQTVVLNLPGTPDTRGMLLTCERLGRRSDMPCERD